MFHCFIGHILQVIRFIWKGDANTVQSLRVQATKNSDSPYLTDSERCTERSWILSSADAFPEDSHLSR